MIVCTHAKFSVIELCEVLKNDNITVIFHPVDYSKEPEILDKLLALGVVVVEDSKQLVEEIKNADVVIEDGARVSKLIKKHQIPVKQNFFAVEQTSGGVRFFKENPPAYHVINVAMSPMKLDIENRRATPEGVIRYFSESTGSLLGGKEVLIIGFGSIGEGIARLARTLGAHVTIYDTLATKRLFAKHHGYAIVEKDQLDHAFSQVDVVFTATNTYQGSTIDVEQVLLMKDGAVICNAGSGRGELSAALQEIGDIHAHDAVITIAEKDEHLTLQLAKGAAIKTVTILAKSYPINLHIGSGTSHDAIEIVMALLLLAAITGPTTKGEAGLQDLSPEIQECVAQAFLSQHNPARTFKPTFVHTRHISVIDKPYGGIFPFHNQLNQAAHMSIARAWFKPGAKTRGHYHRQSQESYYVEKGTADIVLWHADSPTSIRTYSMRPGDYLIVPENYFHDVTVTSDEDFVCLVMATPPFCTWDQFFTADKEHVS